MTESPYEGGRSLGGRPPGRTKTPRSVEMSISIDLCLIIIGAFTFGWLGHSFTVWARKPSGSQNKPRLPMARPMERR